MTNSLNQYVFDYSKEFKKLKYTTILATGSLDVYAKYFKKNWFKFLRQRN